MSDDIGARLGIIHRAGCAAPTTYAAMPFATMTGHNPYVALVADGKGGELFRCRICGMVQGQRPKDAAELADPRPGEPLTDRAREALSKLPAVLADLRRGHARITKTAVAAGLFIDRKTLDSWIGNGWLTWPPGL
ncbi:MAG: hypothetical protein ABSB75_02255 [Candidatus Limnocylindrales bacterium]